MLGVVAADDGGTDEAADEGQRRHQDAVAQRQADGEGGERRGTAAGRHLGDHLVERHRREQRAVEGSDPGGGQRLGDPVIAAAHPLGAADQGEAEQRRQDHPDLGREVSLLDRVAHEEDRRERQGDRADPQEGARAQALLPTDRVPARRRSAAATAAARPRPLVQVLAPVRVQRAARAAARSPAAGASNGGGKAAPSAICRLEGRKIGPQPFILVAQARRAGRAPRWRGWACRWPRRSRARSGGLRPRCPRGRHALPAIRRRRGWPGGRTPRGCPWRRCRASPPCGGSPCAPPA